MGWESVLTTVPLRLGPLAAEGYHVRRSGIRWMCEDGHLCRPGEVIAFCNIGLGRERGAGPAPQPFAREARDLQVALATTVAGRLRQSPQSSRGGFMDRLDFYQLWTPDFVIGDIETDQPLAPPDVRRLGRLRLQLAAGRRGSELAEDRSGLLTGWHLRTRSWLPGGGGAMGTLLSVGICELAGVMKGERSAFLEILEAVCGPAQVVYVPDGQLVPSVRILREQAERGDAEKQAIGADLARTFAGAEMTPGPASWLFAGALLSALQDSPLTDTYEVLGVDGLSQTSAPDAVILSLNAESRWLHRHRRLGYSMQLHPHRQADTGRALGAWLRESFEVVPRTLEEMRADYIAVIDLIRSKAQGRPDPAILILNGMSTNGHEDIQSYAAFDQPMGDTVGTIHAKEANLMLHDLARERDISIVDVDAITADFGGHNHLPDGVHQTGALQAALRAEILDILRYRGVPGFQPSAFS